MRMIVLFDLPVETNDDKREYTHFRKFLIKNGFMMMQQSVYCKIALNHTVVTSTAELIRKNKPKRGLVQLLTITEKQYGNIEFIVGHYDGDIISSDERLIVL